MTKVGNKIELGTLATLAAEIEETIIEKVNGKKKVAEDEFISTGITLLNLALSDNYKKGYKLGTLVNIVGDSSAGKSFIGWVLFAEAIRNCFFDNFNLIYDESEYSFDMNPLLFGDKEGRVNRDIHSKFIDQLHGNILKSIKDKPTIFINDSFDGVKSREEEAREKKLLKEKKNKKEESDDDSEENKESEDDEKQKGSYNLEKQKYASALFRSVVEPLNTTKSLLVIISQTREKINAMFGDKKTRSGGAALRFYSTHEFWLSVIKEIKEGAKEIGILIKLKVKKNKITGKYRTIEFPIYYSYGVGNVESMINWMLSEEFWKKEKGGIVNTGGDFENLTIKELVKYIDDNDLEENCSQIVGKCWQKVEDSLKIKLKPRY